MTKILYGKPVADTLLKPIEDKKGTLGVMLFSENDVAKIYANRLLVKAKENNVDGQLFDFSIVQTKEEIYADISFLGRQGIPLVAVSPFDVVSQQEVEKFIPSVSDVEGINSEHYARLLNGEYLHHTPATPRAMITLLGYYGYKTAGKRCCIIGRGRYVGKPLATMLTNHDATVTLCHSKTPKEDLKDIIKSSRYIFSCAGSPNLITEDMVSPNNVIIDAGVSFSEKLGKMCGDADFDNIKDKVEAITPRVNGVGTVTTATIISRAKGEYW